MSALEIYRNKTVLVTGNTGFKGTWLSLWLKQLGAYVVGYSLDPPSQPNMYESIDMTKHMTFFQNNIRDKFNIWAVMQGVEPEIVFHLAAQPIMRKSIAEPVLTYTTNFLGTLNVLEAVRNTDFVKALVCITSDKCYENDPKPKGYCETDRLGGDDPYSSSKACAELAIHTYRQCYGINVASTRAGNIIGGGDWGSDRLLPDCIRQLSSNQKIVIRNPTHLRPWQFVLDPLYGYLLLGLKLLTEGSKYAQAWNFGPKSENYINVEQLVQKTIKYWGSGEYSIVPNVAIPESHFLTLNCAKSNEVLGWKPKYNIDEILGETISWYKKFYYDKEGLYEFTLSQIKKYMEK